MMADQMSENSPGTGKAALVVPSLKKKLNSEIYLTYRNITNIIKYLPFRVNQFESRKNCEGGYISIICFKVQGVRMEVKYLIVPTSFIGLKR